MNEDLKQRYKLKEKQAIRVKISPFFFVSAHSYFSFSTICCTSPDWGPSVPSSILDLHFVDKLSPSCLLSKCNLIGEDKFKWMNRGNVTMKIGTALPFIS